MQKSPHIKILTKRCPYCCNYKSLHLAFTSAINLCLRKLKIRKENGCGSEGTGRSYEIPQKVIENSEYFVTRLKNFNVLHTKTPV